MEKAIENFIAKPANSWSLIDYLKTRNANQISRMIDQVMGDLYWIKRKAPWVKEHQDKRYIARAVKLVSVLCKLEEKKFFKAEVSCLGNELVRSSALDFEEFQTKYLNGHDYHWLYGDNINCCFLLETESQIVSYVEGDVVVISCKTKEAFDAEVERAREFARTEL